MTKKIKILLLTAMLSSSIPMSAQIYGGDYALPMPTRDIYDTDMMIASLNAARIASEYDSRLLDYLEPIMNDLSQNLRAGNYNTCISKVNDVFRNVTFYKYQSSLMGWFLCVRGLSYLGNGNDSYAISDLVKARQYGDSDADKALSNLFSKYYEKGYDALKAGNYYECLRNINTALSTTYYNYSIYEMGGIAYESMNNFDYAKRYYKIAKKKGSPNAFKMLDDLKKHKKAYNKRYK